jgi:transcriptional regulator with XRE-family HTH domain
VVVFATTARGFTRRIYHIMGHLCKDSLHDHKLVRAGIMGAWGTGARNDGIETMIPTEEEKRALGDRVRELRVARGWPKQSQLAHVARVNQSIIKRCECGETYPDPKNLAAIAMALDVTVPYLMGLIPSLNGETIEVVIRHQSLEVFLGMNRIDDGESGLLRALSRDSNAPTTALGWAQFRGLFSRAQELQKEGNRKRVPDRAVPDPSAQVRSFPSGTLKVPEQGQSRGQLPSRPPRGR